MYIIAHEYHKIDFGGKVWDFHNYQWGHSKNILSSDIYNRFWYNISPVTGIILCVCAQLMREGVTLERPLSLAGRIHRILPHTRTHTHIYMNIYIYIYMSVIMTSPFSVFVIRYKQGARALWIRVLTKIGNSDIRLIYCGLLTPYGDRRLG